jgi:short-subunit dehydrogenase
MKARDARILLTGACGGIGQAAAVALLQAGASVMLAGRSPERLVTLVRDLSRRFGNTGSRIIWRAADLTQWSAIEALREVGSAWCANVVIHGAGLPSFSRFESVRVQDMQQVLNTNLLAPMMLTQAMLPHLRSLPKAQVICMGSALGRIGLPGFSVYSASKFGLRGFAEALRRELADTSVRVQYLGPRSTRTSFNDAAVEAHNSSTGTAMDTPEQVAAAVLQMLENEAAERFLGFPEKFAVRLNGLVPGVLDRAFARHRRNLPDRIRVVTRPQTLPSNGSGHSQATRSTDLPSFTIKL